LPAIELDWAGFVLREHGFDVIGRPEPVQSVTNVLQRHDCPE
jgi:hypothetical protein